MFSLCPLCAPLVKLAWLHKTVTSALCCISSMLTCSLHYTVGLGSIFRMTRLEPYLAKLDLLFDDEFPNFSHWIQFSYPGPTNRLYLFVIWENIRWTSIDYNTLRAPNCKICNETAVHVSNGTLSRNLCRVFDSVTIIEIQGHVIIFLFRNNHTQLSRIIYHLLTSCVLTLKISENEIKILYRLVMFTKGLLTVMYIDDWTPVVFMTRNLNVY